MIKLIKLFLIIIISINYNLYSQEKTSLVLKNLFPEEYIKIDKELCWIIYNHIIYSNSHNPNMDSDVVNKIKKGKEIKDFIISSATSSDSKDTTDHFFSFENKWWNDFAFASSNKSIVIEWNNELSSVTAIFKKEYLNTFRKDSYQKKQDLALTLISNAGVYGKHDSNKISVDSVKVLRSLNMFMKINDTVYFSPNDKYNRFYNTYYYKKDKSSFGLIYNKKYPLESITNLLLSNEWFYKDTIDINLRHKLYANDEVSHTINLSILNKLFSEETNSFISIVDSAKNSNVYKINQLKISNNKQTIHLLKYEIPKDQLFSKSKIIINATLYSNVRLDNLSDIDKEFKNKEPKIKIKL